MHTNRKVAASILLGGACVLGVFGWAEARSTAIFSATDLRDAKRALQEAGEKRPGATTKAEKEVVQLFERVVVAGQSAYLTVTYCGVGVVLISMACLWAIWYPVEREAPNPPEATPGERPPAASSPSPGAPQL